MNNSQLKERFEDFAWEVCVSSPGRINLIGEHTDYNQGFVLPTAIDQKIEFEFRRNGTKDTCHIYSQTYEAFASFDLNQVVPQQASWANYLLGVIDEIQKIGKKFEGFDCIIRSSLPIGAGISSSAALECGFASGINDLFGLGLEKIEIVRLSQAAENNFVGSNCGIMDQYASVMSKKGHLILLDCRSLEAEYIPADFKDCKVLLLNTKVEHNLAEGQYNKRRKECEDAVKTIQKRHPQVKALRDVNVEMLKEFKEPLSSQTFSRAAYVIQENLRVQQAAEAIKSGDLRKFGHLMYQSHHGLQHQYEVSCPELDFLVDYTRSKDFIYGARMMGGGFGGCTINLIESSRIDAFVKEVLPAYEEEFGIKGEAIVVSPSEGTQIQSR